MEGEEEEALMEDRGRPEGGGNPLFPEKKSQSHSEKIRKTEKSTGILLAKGFFSAERVFIKIIKLY